MKTPESGSLLRRDRGSLLGCNLHHRIGRWWPNTLYYLGWDEKPFEIYVKAESKRYFEKFKFLLGIDSPNDLQPLSVEFSRGEREAPNGNFGKMFDPVILINAAAMATRN